MLSVSFTTDNVLFDTTRAVIELDVLVLVLAADFITETVVTEVHPLASVTV